MPKIITNEDARRLAFTNKARYAGGEIIRRFTPPAGSDPQAPVIKALHDIAKRIDTLNDAQKKALMEASAQIIEALQKPEPDPDPPRKAVFLVLERDKDGKCLRFSVTEE